MSHHSCLFIFLLAVVPLLQNCAPLLIGGATATGVTVAQERSVGNAIDDTAIWAAIKNSYMQEDMKALMTGVNVKVNEGRVLLTGKVNTPETRVTAVRLAWQPEGVKEVIDEVVVTDKDSVADYAHDTWVTTQVKSKLLFNRDISSINYSVETVNGVVYLIGVARSQEELEAVTTITSTVRGVKRVISHARLKDTTAPSF